MKVEAAKAIASIVSDEELTAEYVIPSPFNKRVAQVVSEAVVECVKETQREEKQ